MPNTLENIGTVYPSPSSISAHEEKLQSIANEKNGGVIGERIRLAVFASGNEEWAAPALGVKWKEDFN